MKNLQDVLTWMQMHDTNGTYTEAAEELEAGTLTAAALVPALVETLEAWAADAAGTALANGCRKALAILEATTGIDPEKYFC